MSIDERRLLKRLEGASVPEKYAGWDWSRLDAYSPVADQPAADTIASLWVQRFIAGEIVEADAVGLLLYGAPGHGKTALASVALQEALRGSTVATWGKRWEKPYQPSRPAFMAPYRHFPTLTQRQFNNGTTEEEDNLLLDIRGARTVATAVRLLVLDDVGKEHRTSSGWAQGYFEELIRTRAYEGWPTIITTNLHPNDWARTYGSSCESFLHEAFEHVRVESPVGDRRKAQQ